MANNDNGSVNTGSPIANSVPNANNLGGTASGVDVKTGDTKNTASTIDPEQHRNLEQLAGKLGEEVGEYRKFFTNIAPLLEKLDQSPEVVQAIVEGRITNELAKAALEGKVNISDAQIVNKAHEAVKKDLGKEGYTSMSPDEVSRLVESKAKEIKTDFEKQLKEREDLATFETSVRDFITRTPDFGDYADAVDKWLDEHDVTDIAVAYYAVKGELSEKEAKKQAEAAAAEAQKNMALNAGAGGGRATHIQNSGEVVDSLIAGKTNPNVF